MKSAQAKLIERYIRHSERDDVYHETVSDDLDIPLLHLIKTVEHCDALRLKNNRITLR